MRTRPRCFRMLAAAGIAVAVVSCQQDALGPDPASPEVGTAALDIGALAVNDDFDDAVVITSVPFTHSIDTSDATTAPDDPFCFGQGPTVWYRFTPTESGFYEANTFDSEYDTTLSAYLGDRGDLIQIACNDDADGTVQSRVIVELEAGQTVHFMVGAWASGPGGPLVFRLMESGPPPPPPPPLTATLELDRFGEFDPRTGLGTIRGTLYCSRFAFASVFGSLFTRVGRLIGEGFFSTFTTCDEHGERWEVVVRAGNVALTGGPVTVTAEAFVFDPFTGESTFVSTSGTVNLRGGRGGRGGRSDGSATRAAAGPSVRNLAESMRADPRLKVRLTEP